MADKDFVVKNGIVVDTSFSANSSGLYFSNTLTVNTTTFIGTANNVNFVGGIPAANIVSNSQLSSNLSNYASLAGLASNVVTLTSNNTTFVNGKTEGNLNVNNATFAYGKTEGNLNVNNATYAFGKTEGNLNVNNATYAFGKTEGNLNANSAVTATNQSGGTVSATSGSISSVTFQSGGNIGIGTGSPTQKLHVVGNIYASGSFVFSDGSSQSGAAGFPVFNSYVDRSFHTWYQADQNLFVAVTMRGPYMNDFYVYAGPSTSTYYVIARYGDDINSNTKWAPFGFPIKKGSWYYVTTEAGDGPYRAWYLS